MTDLSKNKAGRITGREAAIWARIHYLRMKARLTHALWSCSRQGKESVAGLRRLKGAHAGRRCFVIGNGPSLNQTPMHKLRDEITIGCNGLFLLREQMGFSPTYYTVEDTLVAEDRGAKIAAVPGSTKIIPRDLHRFVPDTGNTLWIHFLRSYAPFPSFTDDFSRRVFGGGTVTFLNLQLAWHLGCDPIILVGVDHNYDTGFKIQKQGGTWTSLEEDKNHFHPDYFGKGFRWHDPNVECMESSYRHALAVSCERGFRILNGTVGGRLEVFPRVDVNAVLATEAPVSL